MCRTSHSPSKHVMVAVLLLLVVVAAPAPTVRNSMKRSPAWETNSASSTENILTLCNTVLLEKLIGPQLVKKFPALYRIRTFITEFTRSRHLSQSYAGLIWSNYPTPSTLNTFPHFIGLKRPYACTRGRRWPLFWIRRIQSTPSQFLHDIQSDTKKCELLKNPTKIEEIQEKIWQKLNH